MKFCLLFFILFFSEGRAETSQSKNYLILIGPREFSESEFRTLEKNLRDGSFTIAALDTNPCFGDSAMVIKPHIALAQIDTLKYDVLILVGGPGILFYDKEKNLMPILHHFSQKGLVGVGIGSLLLARCGILKDKPATTIPDKLAIKELKSHSVIYQDKPVVKAGKILTAPSVNKKLLSEIFRLKG